MEFRSLTPTEVDVAHAIYLKVVGWLKAKNVRQWLRPLTKKEFADRQARGELFAGFLAGRMAAIVSVAFEEDDDWRGHLSREKRWWIKTLTVARAYEGRKLGEQVVANCEALVREAGASEAFLECVDYGFLPDYYARLGYQVLVRANITYPSGYTFPVALMRKGLR
jgi:ribosomal protein S18 acetylase RimI-like enzyme